MSSKIKELMQSAQIRTCVLCKGEKQVKAPAPNDQTVSGVDYIWQRCHACCGSGYQGHFHQPATTQQLATFAEMLTRHTIELQEKHAKAIKRAKDAEERAEKVESGERTMRCMIANLYCPPPHLYYDDGELQDSRMEPFIDFARDAPQVIQSKMIRRSHAMFEKLDKDEVNAILKGEKV